MAISNPSFGVGLTAAIPVSIGQAAGNILLNHQITSAYPVATTSGAVDLVYTAQRTVASSSSDDSIDLSSLNDPAGNAIAFAHVSDLLIQNSDATQALVVGGGSGAVAWLPSAGVAIPPGASMLLHHPAGFAVTTGTAHLVQVAIGAGTAINYNVTIFGRSA